MLPRQPITKSPIEFSIENINRQLRNAKSYSPEKLAEILDFARRNLLKTEKLKRSKNGQPSEIVNLDDTVILKTSVFPYSLLNHEGNIYLFLSGKIYREDFNKDGPNSLRGFRYGTLAIDLSNENTLVFIKVTEYANQLFRERLDTEFKPEAKLYKEYADAKHDTPALRNTKNNTAKIYTITPYKGIETFALIVENRLTPLQTMYLAIQYMLVVYTQLKEKGLVHRDLKPENYTAEILSNGLLNVFVIDFGLAKKMTTDEESNQRYFHDHRLVGNIIHSPASIIYSTKRHYNSATDLFAAASSAKLILENLLSTCNVFDERANNPRRQLFEAIEKLIRDIIDSPTFDANNRSIAILDEDQIKQQLDELASQAENLILGKKVKSKPVTSVFEGTSPQGICTTITPAIAISESESTSAMKRDQSSPPPPPPLSSPPQKNNGLQSPAFFSRNSGCYSPQTRIGAEAQNDLFHPTAIASSPHRK
jgi:serine/threonine protein kinase